MALFILGVCSRFGFSNGSIGTTKQQFSTRSKTWIVGVCPNPRSVAYDLASMGIHVSHSREFHCVKVYSARLGSSVSLLSSWRHGQPSVKPFQRASFESNTGKNVDEMDCFGSGSPGM